MKRVVAALLLTAALAAPATAAETNLGICPAANLGGGGGERGVPLTSSATGTTGSVVATLAATQGRLTAITGFEVLASNGTAGAANNVVVAGTVSGSLNYTINTLAAAATVQGPPPLIVEFPYPIPASALNTAITVTWPALAGGTGVSVTAHGCTL
jgi:hypothetical protein